MSGRACYSQWVFRALLPLLCLVVLGCFGSRSDLSDVEPSPSQVASATGRVTGGGALIASGGGIGSSGGGATVASGGAGGAAGGGTVPSGGRNVGGAPTGGKAGGLDAGHDVGKDGGGAASRRWIPPEPGLKVAFIGDQGPSDNALAVLQLIKDQGADLVIHAGDFDYIENPGGWDARISQVLGPDFPYFASVGNHDLASWGGQGGYQDLLNQRLGRIKGAVCEGELGVNSACTYRGLFFVLSGVGTLGTGHEGYLATQLGRSKHQVRICNWHKNQHDMQVGTKGDEAGWSAYQVCQAQGALVINGHEHSYARTLALSEVGNRNAGHGALGLPQSIQLGPGRTAVIVSGLGGHSQRNFALDHLQDTWWASVYAGGRQVENGKLVSEEALIEAGALFVQLGVEGDARRGRGEFITMSGKVVDRFDVFWGR